MLLRLLFSEIKETRKHLRSPFLSLFAISGKWQDFRILISFTA